MRTKLISAPYTIWMTLFIVVPMGLVAFFAFTDKSGAFTLDNILRVGQYSNVFLRSIWLGAIATAVSLLLGYPLAYSISRMKASRQSMMIMLVMLPMWMNFLLRTYAWMSLLEDNGLINNMLAAVGLPRLHMINTAGAVVLGMGISAFVPMGAVFPALEPEHKGAAVSAHNLASGLTTFCGPFIATVLLNTVGFAGVCWAYAICYISGSVISFWIRPEQPGITRKVAAN